MSAHVQPSLHPGGSRQGIAPPLVLGEYGLATKLRCASELVIQSDVRATPLGR
jgi:hypothetical protein